MPLIVILLLVAAALGGGLSMAANSALPGDMLWGFKTTVNENTEGALAQSDQAKASWDISTAAARLDEAQTLAGKDKFDANTQAAITTNLTKHALDISTLVAKLKAEGKTTEASAVAADFQTMLVQHTKGLTQAPASFLAYVRSLFDEAANLQK